MIIFDHNIMHVVFITMVSRSGSNIIILSVTINYKKKIKKKKNPYQLGKEDSKLECYIVTNKVWY